MRVLTCILLLVLVFFALTFSGLNAQPVSLDYYLGNARLPLALLIILSFIFGCFFGLLFAISICVKWGCANRRLRHRLKRAQGELSSLRTPALEQHSR